MVQLSSFLLVAALATAAPSFAAPSAYEDEAGYFAREFDEVDELSLRELEYLLERAPQPWIATAGKILNRVGTAGTIASIGSSIAGMFKSKKQKRSLWEEDDLDLRDLADDEEIYIRFDADGLDELSLRELEELIERNPEPFLRMAGKVLNGLGTAGTVASIGSAIGGMFKKKDSNKKRSFMDESEDELVMRVFADYLNEMASLERRYGAGNLDELD